MDISQYLDIFIGEAQDHLQEMTQTLLALEKNPDDLASLDAFFRAAHTLKGMSATMGFPQMAGLAHDMEDLLDLLRKKERRLTPDLADLIFQGVDTLADLLRSIVAGEGERVEVAPVREQIRAAREAPPPPEAALPPPGRPQEGWEVRVTVAPDCVLKGPRAFLVLKRLAAVAPIVGADPPEEALKAGQYERQFSLFFTPQATPEPLKEAAASVSEVVEVAVQPIVAAPPAPVPAETPPPETARTAAVAPAVTPLVRVRVSLLDQLLEAASELVIARSHLLQSLRQQPLPDLEDAVELLSRAMGQLQEAVLAMRMTPVGQVFNRFPRMVRDLAHREGKQVQFEMEGLEIELDRSILDQITDPLVHLLRNAVDHGVEPPEERQAAGKPLPARIVLRARRERDTAIIEVTDDGRGMDPQRIGRLAVERGLITAQQMGEMSKADLLELVCLPGFSTSTEVSSVSGRGVGMEVVKQVMDAIGGILELESEVGSGTCFRLSFPLTIAILPALMVRVAGETLAMPMTHIVRTVETSPDQVRRLHRQPILWWEGQPLPLTDLAALLGLARAEGRPDRSDVLSAVVIERDRQRYGLIVDEILGKEEIVLKPLESVLQQIEGLAGATIRGAGEVTLVLDLPGLARLLAHGTVPSDGPAEQFG